MKYSHLFSDFDMSKEIISILIDCESTHRIRTEVDLFASTLHMKCSCSVKTLFVSNEQNFLSKTSSNILFQAPLSIHKKSSIANFSSEFSLIFTYVLG